MKFLIPIVALMLTASAVNAGQNSTSDSLEAARALCERAIKERKLYGKIGQYISGAKTCQEKAELFRDKVAEQYPPLSVEEDLDWYRKCFMAARSSNANTQDGRKLCSNCQTKEDAVGHKKCTQEELETFGAPLTASVFMRIALKPLADYIENITEHYHNVSKVDKERAGLGGENALKKQLSTYASKFLIGQLTDVSLIRLSTWAPTSTINWPAVEKSLSHERNISEKRFKELLQFSVKKLLERKEDLQIELKANEKPIAGKALISANQLFVLAANDALGELLGVPPRKGRD